MIYFSDVDVVSKLANCGFLPWLPGLLGVAESEDVIRYLPSLKSRLARPGKRPASEANRRHLEEFCVAHAFVEGTGSVAREEELLLMGMDPGEALLFAEAELTQGTVVTGDKRALKDYAKFSTPVQRARIKVVCWEQLLLRVRQLHGYQALRQGCCAGIACDGLLGLAFSSGLDTPEEQAVAALQSFLGKVKEHSGDIFLLFDS